MLPHLLYIWPVRAKSGALLIARGDHAQSVLRLLREMKS